MRQGRSIVSSDIEADLEHEVAWTQIIAVTIDIHVVTVRGGCFVGAWGLAVWKCFAIFAVQ